ncbi:MAG: NADH-quinone oxidoreductase subunit L, partial [Candidatus Binataceae bacterium]
MTRDFAPLGLILLFPALGVLWNLFFGRRAGRTTVNFVASAMIVLAFIVSLWAFALLLTQPAGAALTFTIARWIRAGQFHVDLALRFDALTAVMCLVVSGVGALIHVYSAGYMAHDDD